MCLFNKYTGLFCPGCGMTRACLSLFSGDLYQAFRYNPWMISTIPVIIVLWLLLFKRKKMILVRIMHVYMYMCLCYGILRNVPYLSFLAPTNVR